ncbi:MAG: hypothetical protein ACT6Q9_08825, partial [Polaromonas sp.]|uniref:hypothetical protein n=1 Tax=Polaromonas sp. TaxID=1869339 RepID=UPI0040353CBD
LKSVISTDARCSTAASGRLSEWRWILLQIAGGDSLSGAPRPAWKIHFKNIVGSYRAGTGKTYAKPA